MVSRMWDFFNLQKKILSLKWTNSCVVVLNYIPFHPQYLQVAVMPDRAMRLLEIKKLLERMPRANHAVLKFIFQHFVR